MKTQRFKRTTASLIMPVHSDPHYPAKRSLVQAVGAETGWTLLIPEYDLATPSFDPIRAKANLEEVAYVVADLSRARPSCYFELGFAEALGLEIRCIAELGTEIHQTSRRDEVLFFEGLEGYGGALRHVLAEWPN